MGYFSERLDKLSPRKKSLKSSLLLTFVYAILGVLWIFYSDQAALAVSTSPEDFLRLQNIKGWLFIFVSSMLIFSVSLVLGRRRDQATDEFRAVVLSLQSVLNNSPVDILLLRRDGVIVDQVTTSRLSELLGETGRNLSELLNSKEFTAICEAFDVAESGGIPVPVSFSVLTENENSIFKGRLAPYQQEELDEPMFILAVADSTQLMQANRKLSKIDAELKEKESSLKQLQDQLQTFDYSVSNSLKVPLRHIAGFFNLLHDSETSDFAGRESLISNIYSSISSANKLVNDLYLLSQVNLKELELETFDVSLHAHSLFSSINGSKTEREVAFQVEEDLKIQASPFHVTVALKKILENAWNFTAREERAEIEVRAGTEPRQGFNEITITDNGIGFDNDEISLLLEPYSLTSAPDDMAGHGLGLVIAQRVMLLHHGYLELDGKPGKGATITLGFPEQA